MLKFHDLFRVQICRLKDVFHFAKILSSRFLTGINHHQNFLQRGDSAPLLLRASIEQQGTYPAKVRIRHLSPHSATKRTIGLNLLLIRLEEMKNLAH